MVAPSSCCWSLICSAVSLSVPLVMTAGASWATPFLPAGSAAEPASTIRFMLTVGTPVRGASTTFNPFDRVKRSKLGKSA
ncbi:hypothetical protein D3C80_1219700 [compost metagenome]